MAAFVRDVMGIDAFPSMDDWQSTLDYDRQQQVAVIAWLAGHYAPGTEFSYNTVMARLRDRQDVGMHEPFKNPIPAFIDGQWGKLGAIMHSAKWSIEAPTEPIALEDGTRVRLVQTRKADKWVIERVGEADGKE